MFSNWDFANSDEKYKNMLKFSKFILYYNVFVHRVQFCIDEETQLPVEISKHSF